MASLVSASLRGCELKLHMPTKLLKEAMSASLRGCELKCLWQLARYTRCCQPPCEAVNWNTLKFRLITIRIRQPPCEAVNWNAYNMTGFGGCCGQPPCEAVNWNAQWSISIRMHYSQPPCEAVNWNERAGTGQQLQCVSLLARLWIEMLVLLNANPV